MTRLRIPRPWFPEHLVGFWPQWSLTPNRVPCTVGTFLCLWPSVVSPGRNPSSTRPEKTLRIPGSDLNNSFPVFPSSPGSQDFFLLSSCSSLLYSESLLTKKKKRERVKCFSVWKWHKEIKCYLFKTTWKSMTLESLSLPFLCLQPFVGDPLGLVKKDGVTVSCLVLTGSCTSVFRIGF